MNTTDQFTPADDAPHLDDSPLSGSPYVNPNDNFDTSSTPPSDKHSGGYSSGDQYGTVAPTPGNTPDGPKWEATPVSDSDGALELPHPTDPNATVKFVGGAKPPPTQVQRYDGVWNPVTQQAVWTCGRCGLAFSQPGIEHRDTVGRICEPFLDPAVNAIAQVDPAHAGDTQAVHSGRVVVGGAHVLPGQDVRALSSGASPQVAAAAHTVASGGTPTGPGGESIAAQTAFGGTYGVGGGVPAGGPLSTQVAGAAAPPINPIINAGPGLAPDAQWSPAPNQPPATSAYPGASAPGIVPPPGLDENPGGSSTLSAAGYAESQTAYRAGESEPAQF